MEPMKNLNKKTIYKYNKKENHIYIQNDIIIYTIPKIEVLLSEIEYQTLMLTDPSIKITNNLTQRIDELW